MSTLKGILYCVCLIALTQLAWSQGNWGAHAPREDGVPGHVDPKTGAFTARAQTDPRPSPDITYNIWKGEYEITFSITIKSATQSGDLLTCYAEISTYDQDSLSPYTAGTGSWDEHATSTVTSPPSTASCTVDVPYEWVLIYPTTDTVDIYYKLDLIHGYTFGSTTTPEDYRHSDHTYNESATMPLNGATTSITISNLTL